MLAKRAALIPDMLAARKEGKQAFLVRHILIIKKQRKPPDDARAANGKQNDHERTSSNISDNEVV